MSSFFDVAANTYDTTFTNTKIGLAQRKKVYRNLKPIFKATKKMAILEVNCGTGIDALEFDKKDHDITATDISENMIKIAEHKNKTTNVTFSVLDCKNLDKSELSKTQFDIIFSNFGGLNCLSSIELNQFIQTVYSMLKPSGKLIMVLMPKKCIWERLYFWSKGNFKKAKRRDTNNLILANVEGKKVPTWYYSPSDIISMSKKNFSVAHCVPIGILVPPSYLEKSFLTKFPIWNVLNTIESYINFRFLAKYADHFLIELEKK